MYTEREREREIDIDIDIDTDIDIDIDIDIDMRKVSACGALFFSRKVLRACWAEGFKICWY